MPDQATRQDVWRLEYRRNSYLRPLLEEKLYARFDEVTLVNSLAFLEDSPLMLDMDQRMVGIRMFQ